MIDWWGMTCNAFWISGLSIILAAFSYVHWWAHDQRIRLSVAIRQRGFLILLLAGMFLVGLGLFTTSRIWWEKTIWGVVILLLLWQSYTLLRELAQPGDGAAPAGR